MLTYLLSIFHLQALEALEALWPNDNLIGDAGLIQLASALEDGKLPALQALYLNGNPASGGAQAAVEAALARRSY